MGVGTLGSHVHSGADITSGTVADARVDPALARDAEVTAAIAAAIAALPPSSDVFSGAKVYNNTTQAVTTGGDRVLVYNAEDYDTDGYHDNVTNNGRLTVPTGKAGWFHVTTHVYAVGAMNVDLRFRVNGTSLLTDVRPQGLAGNGLSWDTDLHLAAGDYVEAICTPQGNITLGSAATREAQNDFAIARLGS